MENTREFKVQVGFSAIFKKLKKDIDLVKGKEVLNGNYDYLTFFKESLLTRDGVALKFNEPWTAFKCSVNTTIVIIINCLDTRNVPNMDIGWRYHSLKSATIKSFFYNTNMRARQGFKIFPVLKPQYNAVCLHGK